ncbi:NF-kappa-B inhibitor alpha (ECI-6) (I-kappa-B-alpha) (IkB-alpha) (IkappaBalpha), partial [Durusdinium trenchii]
ASRLLEEGADPHLPDGQGNTPLHAACSFGGCLRSLQSGDERAGEDYVVRNVAQRNAWGQSPAELASLQGSLPEWLKRHL